ncbi:hypothetical protein [Paracoccus yeei]|uniref:hypothetical protein n=1 Tax=Paracoccus yeei TaxID=147645 RepID=UPI00048DE5C2|nr:hypothetical protein [Paracoccus yeei]OWJ95083.1 hypothetical protein CDV54_08765 [Paracoccus yeei]
MTLGRDHDWPTRLLGTLIWLVMSLVFSIELCAMIGWAFGKAECGSWFGVLLNGLLWFWALWNETER